MNHSSRTRRPSFLRHWGKLDGAASTSHTLKTLPVGREAYFVWMSSITIFKRKSPPDNCKQQHNKTGKGNPISFWKNARWGIGIQDVMRFFPSAFPVLVFHFSLLALPFVHWQVENLRYFSQFIIHCRFTPDRLDTSKSDIVHVAREPWTPEGFGDDTRAMYRKLNDGICRYSMPHGHTIRHISYNVICPVNVIIFRGGKLIKTYRIFSFFVTESFLFS